MKPIRLLLLLVILCGAASCATMGLSGKVQKTSVGMSKSDVVKRLGDKYDAVHSMLTPEGNVVEILLFTDGLTGIRYEYEFVNDTLVRYTKLADVPENEHHHHHRDRK